MYTNSELKATFPAEVLQARESITMPNVCPEAQRPTAKIATYIAGPVVREEISTVRSR